MTPIRFHYSEVKAALWALSYKRRDLFDKLVWDRLGRDSLEAMAVIAMPDGKEAKLYWRSPDHPLQVNPLLWEEITPIDRIDLSHLIMDLSPTEWSRNEPDEDGYYRGLVGWTPLAVPSRFVPADPC